VAQRAKTIYDVAQAAGVSIATVSRALCASPQVSKKTAARVQAVAAALGYRPNPIARGLGSGHSDVIAVIVPEITHPYYAELYSAADAEARRNGLTTMLYCLAADEVAVARFGEHMTAYRFMGALFVGGVAEATDEALAGMLTGLAERMPVVAICPPLPGLQCICLYNDLTSSTRQAVRHLHTLGHRRIAFLGGTSVVRTSGARGMGFLEELRTLDLPCDDIYQHEAGYTPEAGQVALMKLLSATPRAQWPTAMVAINDLVALGALRQLRRMGLRVPEDMAVVGCDNQFFSPYTDPPLTTVDLHPAEHARSAIQELLGARVTPVAPFTLMREATLIVRESCGVQLGYRRFA
jgi:DNA-binding LacI/PurR family transcriptional regulator